MPKPKKRPDAKKCRTCNRHKLEYIQAHLKAGRRTARGQEQRRCPECNLWCWPDEFVAYQKGGA